MSKFTPRAVLATFALFAVAPVALQAAKPSQPVQSATGATATQGKMIYGPDGHRLASVYSVQANGDAELIIDGHMVTVPASSLSEVNGKLTTSLTKSQLMHQH